MNAEQKAAKRYLSRGYRLDGLIKVHREELERLRWMMGSIPSAGAKPAAAHGGSGGSGEQNTVINAVALEQQIAGEIEKMTAVLREIHDAIETVPDETGRLILHCRYELFLTWSDIASRVGYSYRQTVRMHNSALKSIQIPEKRSLF